MKSFTKMSLDEFKEKLGDNGSFRNQFVASDVIDMDNGTATIHRGNLTKYLEKYMCKTEEDLENTLWFSYGVFVRIVD